MVWRDPGASVTVLVAGAPRSGWLVSVTIAGEEPGFSRRTYSSKPCAVLPSATCHTADAVGVPWVSWPPRREVGAPAGPPKDMARSAVTGTSATSRGEASRWAAASLACGVGGDRGGRA